MGGKWAKTLENCNCSCTTLLHLADHGGQVASVEQRVLGVSHSGRIFEGFLIGEGSPLWADINHTVTWQTNVGTIESIIAPLKNNNNNNKGHWRVGLDVAGSRRQNHTVESWTSSQTNVLFLYLAVASAGLAAHHISTVSSNGWMRQNCLNLYV